MIYESTCYRLRLHRPAPYQESPELGLEHVAAVDPREDRRDEAVRDGAHQAYPSIDQALKADVFDFGVIALPTGLHIRTALPLAEKGLHLFIEKPLDKDLTGADSLTELVQSRNLVTMIGFCLRFSPSAIKLKELAQSGAVGRLIFIRGEYSSYLPNWHKYEDYRRFYMASQELGGGALLDECHILDLAHMLAGDFQKAYAEVNKISDLEIETDDCFDFLITAKSGVVCNLHGDIFSQPARDNLVVVGTLGTISWNIGTDEVGLTVPGKASRKSIPRPRTGT